MNNKIDEKSITVKGIKGLIDFISIFSLYSIIIRLKYNGEFNKVPPFIAELYVWSFLILIFFLLSTFNLWNLVIQITIVVLSIYRLVDLLDMLGREIFIDSENKKNSTDDSYYILIKVRNVKRWFILRILNIFEIVFCFSILILFWGSDFYNSVLDPLTAIYQSMLTMTTLGYGEIHANGSISKFLVIFQLFYFFLFIVLSAPIVLSSMRSIGTNDSKE